MIKRILCISLIVFSALFSSENAYAEKANYSVNGIEVNETANSATEAREIAISKGKKIAFSILLTRMSLNQSYMSWISSDEIDQMIQSMQIENEELTQNSYSAVLNITFSNNFVEYVFSKYGIGKSSSNITYMVIPVQSIDFEKHLWSKKNIWMENWTSVLNELSINNIILPLGSIDDIAMIDMNTLSEPVYEDFSGLISNYDVDGLIIAEAYYIKGENKLRIVLKDVKETGTEETKLDYFNVNNLDHERLYNKAAHKTIKYISGTYISKQRKDTVESGTDIFIPIVQISEWLEIKNGIKNIANFENVKVVYVTKNLVKVNIKHNLNEDVLPGIFEEKGLFLIKKFDNKYYLYSGNTNRLL